MLSLTCVPGAASTQAQVSCFSLVFCVFLIRLRHMLLCILCYYISFLLNHFFLLSRTSNYLIVYNLLSLTCSQTLPRLKYIFCFHFQHMITYYCLCSIIFYLKLLFALTQADPEVQGVALLEAEADLLPDAALTERAVDWGRVLNLCALRFRAIFRSALRTVCSPVKSRLPLCSLDGVLPSEFKRS